MKNNENTVSFQEISKEMFREEGKEGNLYDFDEYYRTFLKRIKEILSALGIDILALKDRNAYKIDSSKKSIVKELVGTYTTKGMKLVRRGNFEKMNIDELRSVLINVEELLKGSLDDEKYKVEMNRVYVVTGYPILERMQAVRDEGIAQIIEDMEEFRPILIEESLSHSDRVYLLNYYKILLNKVTEQWKETAEIMSHNRLDEILDITSRLEEKELCKDTIEAQTIKKMKNSEVALQEAVLLYNENCMDDGTQRVNRPTVTELERTRKFLDKLKHQKKSEIGR